MLEALDHWPQKGIPDKPGAWLLTTARRKGLDRLRREARYREKLIELEASRMGSQVDDDRLRLIFTCCHPALSREAQLALTLRSVMGFTTPEIARAFLTSEPTVAQRIVRAKRKIVDANIPFKIPAPEELDERLAEVLAVLYLTFNEGYLSTFGPAGERRHLAEDAEWLAALLVRLMPDEPEALGLLALMRLHLARSASRFDAGGRLILLKEQDRSLWDRGKIAGAILLLQRAERANRRGPYQLQAAIAACHAQAHSWEATNWVEILGLYEGLLCLAPSPVIGLNRAIALSHVAGPQAALMEVDELASQLGDYYLFHATRAELLRKLGRFDEARNADREALKLTNNPAERDLIERRLNG